MSEPAFFTVSQLTRSIKDVLEARFDQVVVRGEISNFKHHSSGHMYFTLKDAQAELSAVMFRGLNRQLTFQPADGLAVEAHGRITVFERRGSYQILVQRMEPAGMGALYQAYEILKKKLEREGLFDPRRKKDLPAFPLKVGVITSGTGAALRDIMQILERRAPHIHVILRPTLVQGPDAAQDIVAALQQMEEAKPDVIILGRGGGSIEDLWPFNEEMVARAMAAATIPLIAAVGHETDTTIADYVADLRAPTPSAAAELASPATADIVEKLTGWQEKAGQEMLRRVQSTWQYVDQLTHRVQMQNPIQVLKRFDESLISLEKRMKQALSLILAHRQTQVSGMTNRLAALNPTAVLHRGYSIAQVWPEGKIIHGPDDIAVGAEFSVRTGKGSFRGKRIAGENSQTSLLLE